jgi:N-formylglutamate amidohydrolase
MIETDMVAPVADVLALAAPRRAAAPAVFDSPHSGTRYPDDFATVLAPEILRRAEDAHVDELYRAAPDHGAPLLAALFPRSYIDPNRVLADLDSGLLAEPWPEPLAPTDKTRRGQGLIWRRAPPDHPLYDRRLTVAEVRHRIDAFYRPYHTALAGLLDAAHAQFGCVWHVNCHSMPSISTEMSPEGPGKARPDFVLGDRDGASCAPEFTHLVGATLSGLGYRVAVNDPYKGAELVRAYADPAAGRHSLQIEIKRALYMDEATFERNDGFARLQADLTRVVAAVCGHAEAHRA